MRLFLKTGAVNKNIKMKVKQSVIISNKHSIYELSLELSDDLRLRILGNQEKSRKSKNLIEL